MAQAGYTPIQLYYSTTAAAVPLAANLAQGELAINIADGKLYYENSSGVVTLLAGAGGAGIVAGSNTQLQFNNSGVFGASANLTWDGTTLSSTQVNITGQGTLRLQDTTGGEYVGLRSPSALGASYTLTFPADDGTSGQALITDGSGVLSWSTAASGDVYGPGSSTDNAVARFDSTTGKLLQNSVVLIGDTGAVTGVTDLTTTGNTTLGDATTDTVTVNGYMGVGGAGASTQGLSVVSTALTGVGQIGFASSITATSAATNNARAIYGKVSTAASAFTVGNVYNIFSDDATKGAGSTISNLHGLYIADQTQGANNYGITSAISSGTNKWNIYASGTAANYFAGDVTLGNGATLKIDDQDSITFGTFSAGTTGVLLQGGTSTSFLAYQAGKERMALGTTEAVFNDPGNDVDFRVESDTNTHALFVDAGSNTVGILSDTIDTSHGTRAVQIGSAAGVNTVLTISAGVDNTNDRFATLLLRNTGNGGATNRLIYGVNDSTPSTGNIFNIMYENPSTGIATTQAKFTSSEVVLNDDSLDQDFRVESDTNTHALFVDAGNSVIGVNNSTPATNLAGYDSAIAFGTFGKVIGANNTAVAASGYLDLTVNSGGGAFNGFLTVANVYALNATQRTQVTYSIFGRGTNSFSAQLIATDDGSTAGMAITISNPADGVIRITNSALVTSYMTAAFFGCTGF